MSTKKTKKHKRKWSNAELSQTKHKHGLLGSGYIRESISALYYEANTDCNIIFAKELIATIVCYFDYILFDELQLQLELQFIERWNEIYPQQVQYIQDHLGSLRSLVQDKENIIQNLILRYDLGNITKTSTNININAFTDEKIEITVQRFCLENFDLRETANELRDENFHLRNEIYEQQSVMHQQLLQINKSKKIFPGVKDIQCGNNDNIKKEKPIKVDRTDLEYILDTILVCKELPQKNTTNDKLDKTLSKPLENILKKVEALQATTELTITQKIVLSDGAHEIYGAQLKSLQDNLALLRSLIQRKENITENLMLRYDLRCINITQERNRQDGNLAPDEIETTELRQKSKALAEHTILENCELREMVNELQDENFQLRNEIYEQQYQIKRQVIKKNL